MSKRQNVDELNLVRSMVYNFLSSLFAKELDQKLVNSLNDQNSNNFLDFLAKEPRFVTDINQIKHVLQQLNTEHQLLELSADFCGLFLMDGKHNALPYAGNYLAKDDNFTFGAVHQDIAQMLAKSHITVAKTFPEPSDHIAVLLAYMATLCINNSSQEQKNFLDYYLLNWLKDFAQLVREKDQGQFYSAVASFTYQWLLFDSEALT